MRQVRPSSAAGGGGAADAPPSDGFGFGTGRGAENGSGRRPLSGGPGLRGQAGRSRSGFLEQGCLDDTQNLASIS